MWKLLDEGETMQKGDEVYRPYSASSSMSRWTPVSAALLGSTWSEPQSPVRRLVSVIQPAYDDVDRTNEPVGRRPSWVSFQRKGSDL